MPEADRPTSGVEARRSPRVLLQVAIRIEQGETSCRAHRAVVNREGALILSPVAFLQGSRLLIENVETQEQAPFRVVWCGDEDLPGLYKLGIEMLEQRFNFWGPEYDKLLPAQG